MNPNGPFYSSQVSPPQTRQPWTNQASVGWSHQLAPSTVVDVDYVHTNGHDLGVRWALNTRVNGGARRYADLPLNPTNPTLNLSVGSSQYDGVNIGVRRRMDRHVQMNVWYSLAKATGRGGQAVDELTTNLVQDSTNPFADVQNGPAFRTDARHRFTLSAIIQAPWGINVSPIYRYRSATPIHNWLGYDANADGVSNDITALAYQYTGISDTGVASYKEIGPCKTVNCGRGASLSQLNLRVSKVFPVAGHLNVEAIGEVFNLTNAINPNFTTVGAAGFAALYTGTLANHTPNASFMKPNAFAGDSGQPEQRVGQIGFRITF